MPREFKITAVSIQQPKIWNSSYGPMETYQIKVEDEDEAISINRKPGNIPKQGDLLFGEISQTKYGKKFTSQSRPNTSPAPHASSHSINEESKSRTMYVAYAKDIAVALLETGGFDDSKFQQIIKSVSAGGDALFDYATIGLAISKEVDESLNGRGRVEGVFGRTEQVYDVPEDF